MIPGKVLVLTLVSWVKERHHLTAARIKGEGFIVFAIVTPLASQCQVVCGTGATHILWHDMFNRETLGRVGLLAETVFATALRTLADEAPQLARNAWLRHAALVEGLTAA